MKQLVAPGPPFADAGAVPAFPTEERGRGRGGEVDREVSECTTYTPLTRCTPQTRDRASAAGDPRISVIQRKTTLAVNQHPSHGGEESSLSQKEVLPDSLMRVTTTLPSTE